ncbi:MAG TPA: flagellar export chaperone FliS [Gemmatimonadales bacterium]|jgi:flagellar protein FliS|nr:flagellar export chaperone FliS [Gemmatimonadales bacterium]
MTYPTNSRYREMEIMALPPERRLVMIYSHLLVLLRQARRHIELNEVERRGERIIKAQEIVFELTVTLDRESGGQLAQQLASLYAWLLREFAAIHSRPDLTRLDAVIRIVGELHEAWEGAAAQLLGPPVGSA